MGMNLDEAHALDARISQAELTCAQVAGESYDTLTELIEQARTAKIHTLLGFPTFAAYRRDARRKLVETLHKQGISNRTIAAVAGVTEGTVRNDLKGGESDAQNCARKPNAERVIKEFEELLDDADLWPTLDLARLKGIHITLGRVIEGEVRTRPLGAADAA